MKQKTIKNTADLLSSNLIASKDQPIINQVAAKYAVSITPQLAELMQHEGIRRQFVPDAAELINSPQELSDPIGDKTYSPVKGLVHRYPDRCLLKPVNLCPVYCRFCFRREAVGPGNAALTATELQACYAYIRQHPAIWEVILSGGDPLILKPKHLGSIISELDQIAHVAVIRIHTRIPVVDSARINPEMLAVLTQRKPIYIVLHINHPTEFSPTAIEAINKLADSGIVLLGQSVLLKGINDNIETLSELMRCMVKHRIKPYYLHHADLAAGTGHFRTSIEIGQQLMTELRGRFSGLCQPEYVLDIPGGSGKSPLKHSYVRTSLDGQYTITDYNGLEHAYID